jgi:hypothetical protein
MAKNKDIINITPSKVCQLLIKMILRHHKTKPKKKRKYKKRVNTDLFKMPTMPSYIPTGDVSYIKPQYAMTSLKKISYFPEFLNHYHHYHN